MPKMTPQAIRELSPAKRAKLRAAATKAAKQANAAAHALVIAPRSQRRTLAEVLDLQSDLDEADTDQELLPPSAVSERATQ